MYQYWLLIYKCTILSMILVIGEIGCRVYKKSVLSSLFFFKYKTIQKIKSIILEKNVKIACNNNVLCL